MDDSGEATSGASSAGWRMVRMADRLAVPAWLPLVALVLLLVPVFSINEIDADEGLNAEVARRLADGHELYSEIWYDQPPLYPAVLAIAARAARMFSTNEAAALLIAGRMLSLLAGAALLATIYHILRREVSTVAAAVACLWLVLAYQFVRSASASMPPLPAVALATVGCWFTIRCTDAATARRAAGWACAAGAAIACSFLTKPIAWFVPLLAAWCILLVPPRDAGRRNSRLPLLAMMIGVFVATALLLGLAMGGQRMLHSVLHTGWGDVTRHHFAGQDVATRAWYVAERSWPLLAAAALGLLWLLGLVIASTRHRPDHSGPPPWLRSTGGVALVWLIAAAASIAWHRPIWWHHFQIVLVPLAWLAGYGAQCLLDIALAGWRRGHVFRIVSAAAVAALIGLTYGSAFTELTLFRVSYEAKASKLDEEAIALLRAAPPGPVFADRLLYTVAADRAAPPWWAAIGEKRLRSDPTFPHLAGSLEESRVSAVLLARWEPDYLGPDFAAWLDSHFTRVGGGDGVSVWYRRDE